MRSLLLIAHGSRRAASNEEVRRIGRALAAKLGGNFRPVEVAFLELAEPDIATAVDRLVAAGSNEVVWFPYFLAAGRHIAHDLPELLTEARARHPEITFSQMPYLGALPGLTDWLASSLTS